MFRDNDPIREFQAKVQRSIDRAERLRPIIKACYDAIERSGLKVDIMVGNRNMNFPMVELLFMCKKLNETIPLFRELAKEGLRTDKEDPYKDDKLMDVIPMRQYKFGPDVSMIVMLMQDENSDGATCRMEQVGVKEVPIYEMKCD